MASETRNAIVPSTAMPTASQKSFPMLPPRLRALGLTLAILAATANTALAQLYWDSNGNTAGAGATPSAIWSTAGADKNWNSSSAGTSATAKWTNDSAAIFSAGTDATGNYTVTVSATISVASITVQEGNPTFSGGTVNLSGTNPQISVASGSNLTFGSAFTGTGAIEKTGTGTLTFNSTFSYAGELRLTGGTIALAGITATVGTLHITGNTVLDFGNSTASTLNATTFVIDSGVTLSITNWVNATDFFYAQNWTGATANVLGSAPMNQITFSGSSSSNTHWQSSDKQVTGIPVPEPATYGAIFIGMSLACVLWRRRTGLVAA
ncbi:MAG: hypothetical protein JWM88_2950 [Verrucomicrobia bacterium]|nr:hypothetical protein [Verrucomicrobiota bacterium]